MLRKLQELKKRNEGFTIVEVMIVLAIAGLIILIVFLAIPALQRNSRNTTQRDAVSRVLAAVQEATNNNNGNLPGTAASDNTAISGLSGLTNGKTVVLHDSALSPAVAAPTADRIDVIYGRTCTGAVGTIGPLTGTGALTNTSLTGMTQTAGASGRSYVAVFIVEVNGGSFQTQCQSS